MNYILLLMCSLMLSGCFTTTLSAPENTRVRILSENEKALYHHEYKDWYLFAGTLPIHRQDIAQLIRDEKLVEVRVKTEDTISDGVITFLTDMILPVFPQTIVVEGNTADQIKQSRNAPRVISRP